MQYNMFIVVDIIANTATCFFASFNTFSFAVFTERFINGSLQGFPWGGEFKEEKDCLFC